MKRRKARAVSIGTVRIGGNAAVAIQSMTKTDTSDIRATVSQIRRLKACGCEIVRLAVKRESDARAFRQIRRRVHIPLVADIHFNWRFALLAVEHGADKIRLNPGNISRQSELTEVIAALKQARIPLRIGLNSGSVKGGRGPMPKRLVTACLSYVRRVEKLGFRDIVLSLKASTVRDTIEAYRQIAKVCDYPLHLGVTATGTPFGGAIKSGIALGVLLLEGIGDTIRVSLTDKPETEVYAAQAIIEAVGLRTFGPEIVSCPTCGRCEVDLRAIVREIESRIKQDFAGKLTRPLRVAVMGCVVNGPGEAREADIGVAFGSSAGMLFRHGEPVRKLPLKDVVRVLYEEVAREVEKKTAS